MEATTSDDSASSALPQDLAEMVIRHLPPSALRSLFRATPSFGQQPTQALATRLCLDVAQLGRSTELLSGWPGGLAHVRALDLSTSDAPSSAACGQLALTVIFLSRSVPSMQHLTRLDLIRLPLSFALAAATCLATAAPPALTRLRFAGLADDVAPAGSGIAHLWPALAGVASLRRLELNASLYAAPVSVAGATGLRHLESLLVEHANLLLRSLPALEGLTQLDLRGASGVDGVSASMHGYAALRELSMPQGPDDSSWTALLGLTRLEISHRLPHSPVYHAVYEGLVSLTAASGVFECPLLLPCLPALVELDVGLMVLPVEGAGVQSFILGSLAVDQIVAPALVAGARVAGQSVAHTFPRLAALHLRTEWSTAPELWPPGPEGHMLHLRTLTLAETGTAFLPLAHAAVAAAALEVEVEKADGCLAGLPVLHALGPRLQRAVLSGWLKDTVLYALVSGWPHLADLALSGGDTLTDNGLVLLSHACRLRRVSLLQCPGVTALGVAALAARPSMELIKVRGCPGVSSSEVDRVCGMLGRPHLTVDLY